MAFSRLIRVGNLAVLALGVSFYYYLILIPAHVNRLYTYLVPFTHFEFVLFVLSILLVAAAGSIINDYFSFEHDKEFIPERPLAQGVFSLDAAMYLHAAFAFAGIGLGFYLGYTLNNYRIGYFYIIVALLLYLYASYLKKIVLVGNVLIATLMSFAFVLLLLFEVSFLKMISFDGANFVLDMLLWQVKFYGGFVFLVVFAKEMVEDIANRKSHKEYNIQTLAVQFGETVAKITAAAVLVGLMAALVFFMLGFIRSNAVKEAAYLAIAVILPILFAGGLIVVANSNKQYTRIQRLLQLVLLLGIFSIPAFYLFNKQ